MVYGNGKFVVTPRSSNQALYADSLPPLVEQLVASMIGRVQVASYKGDNTYGENNPTSITFEFPPKYVRLVGCTDGDTLAFNWDTTVARELLPFLLPTDFKPRCGFGYYLTSYCKRSEDGKTITWYNTQDAGSQVNLGLTYYFLGIG